LFIFDEVSVTRHGKMAQPGMDSERWKRVEDLYYQVAAHPPERRAALLDAACSSDAELRREVESLLAASNDAGDFLSSSDLPRHIEDLRSESASPAVGSKLGDYEILSVLGAGAMGEVYRARDTRLGREVALKILPPYLTHDQSRVARFQSEARAASALNHINSVTIYEIGQASGTWFIAAELIEGCTLRERMKRGVLPVEEALDIVVQCAGTLAAAHRSGIIHRDVKPENIMIRPDGVVKVVDFGLARILEPGNDWAVEATQTGSVMGTPRYMSPEQARGLKPDARSDIFSLAAVLFEMVAGKPAFPGSTAPEIFAALLASEPQIALAGPLAGPLSKALVKDPAARYQTMEEFANELRNFDPSKASRASVRSLFTPRRAVIAASLVAVAGLAAYWPFRDSPREVALKVVPLATSAGPKAYPALSPDGARIAFSWMPPTSTTRHIYIQPVAEGEPKQLTTSRFHDAQAAWSPDGRQIAFTRQSNGDKADVPQDVFLISSEGGAERKLAETWRGLSWSSGAKEIALTRVPNEGTTPSTQLGGISLVSVENGQSRVLTTGYRDSFPVFSPDGKWIAFKRQATGSAAQIFAIRAEGGVATQLTFDPLQPIRASTWTPDSREVVFASLRSGSDGSLWRVPVNSGKARPVSATLRDAADPTISRQGRLAHLAEWIDSNLYLLTANGTGFSDPLPVVNSSREDHSPAFSPDGERIAFVSERSGNLEVWVSRRDGSRAVQLTSLRAQNTGTPQWSPDGRRIAFDSWASGKSDVYVVDSGGGAPRVLTSGALGSWMPTWSPDGQWIYFSRGLSGASDIWKMPAAGGEAVRLTHSGAFEARTSPDGAVIYYSKQTPKDGRAIWCVPAQGGEEKPVQALAEFRRIGRSWGVTEQGIYFVSYEDSPQQTVRLLSFRTNQVTPLFRLQKQVQWGIRALDFSRDGRYALGAQLDHSVSDLMLIDNFR